MLAVQSNEVYPTPCPNVPSINFVAASDKRCSLGVRSHPRAIVATKRVPTDSEREHRILYEAVVDCYNETERATGWYYYLERALSFPFKARCQSVRNTSPLAVGDVVHVASLADEEDCMNEVMVNVEYGQGTLSVPLAQLTCITRRKSTLRGVGDWHYWVARGYSY